MSSADGSHITGNAAGAPRRCEVCGDELGDEQWWVTRFPRAVHTRCRDWTRVAFPFARHVDVLTQIARRHEGEERAIAHEAIAALSELARTWPSGGAESVVMATAIVRRARTSLGARGLEAKLLGRLA